MLQNLSPLSIFAADTQASQNKIFQSSVDHPWTFDVTRILEPPGQDTCKFYQIFSASYYSDITHNV